MYKYISFFIIFLYLFKTFVSNFPNVLSRILLSISKSILPFFPHTPVFKLVYFCTKSIPNAVTFLVVDEENKADVANSSSTLPDAENTAEKSF